MFKKTTKFFAGVALLVQAFSSVVMFFINIGRKKSSSGAWLALAAVTGAAGGYLVYDAKKSEEDYDDWDDALEDDYDDEEDELDIDESELFSRSDEAEAGTEGEKAK